ncbi:MAG TPA: 50S ribosomal protein L16 [Candidatus Parcubacteria bacterium]|nr:50S ribosomal protein L16 [Candidatus Parcubacteria bacterium]
MLMPKKTKHRKWRKKAAKVIREKGSQLSFGSYGLKSVSEKWITGRQLEAARRVIIRYLRKRGKLWIRVFPDKPVTKKGTEVPMGGGKGAVDHYVFPITPGRIIFELDGIEEDQAKEALLKAGDKLSIKTKFVKKVR